jgi:hypothetical protein
MFQPVRTAVYVDGFNLFYWLKPLPYRWVDLKALTLNAIAQPGKEHEIVAIKYIGMEPQVHRFWLTA